MAALFHRLKRARGQHVHKLSAAQGLHDDHRNPLGGCRFESLHSGLRHFIEIIVLDLTEIPVVVIQDLQEVLGVAVIGKTYVPNSAACFFVSDPLKDPNLFELIPHSDVCQMMHQVVIYVCGPQTRQFLLEVFIQPLPAADHILRKLRRDIDLLPHPVSLQDLPEGSLAARINIGRIVIVYAGPEGGQNFLLRLIDVYTVSLFSKTHAAVTQD